MTKITDIDFTIEQQGTGVLEIYINDNKPAFIFSDGSMHFGQIKEVKAEVDEKAKVIAEKDAEISKISDAAKRKDVMSELTAPLSKEQTEIMNDLLESVQTDKLQKQFDKYMPAVIDGKTPAKKKATLTESEAKAITGNKEESNVSSVSSEATSKIVDIRRLAGLN